MPETRYLRSISSPEAYGCPPDDLDSLLQRGYSDSTREPDALGIRLLQDSLSLYAVDATKTDGALNFDAKLLSEVAILHAASSRMGKPNRHFLDFTDDVGVTPCPQEDSLSPFASLRARHHSLKVVASGGNVPDLIQKICLAPAQIHTVTTDDLDARLPSLIPSPLDAEWQEAHRLLSERFDPLKKKSQRSQFAFWVRHGLLAYRSGA